MAQYPDDEDDDYTDIQKGAVAPESFIPARTPAQPAPVAAPPADQPAATASQPTASTAPANPVIRSFDTPAAAATTTTPDAAPAPEPEPTAAPASITPGPVAEESTAPAASSAAAPPSNDDVAREYQQYKANQLKYLKAQGAQTQVLPTGAEVPQTDADGNQLYKPALVNPFTRGDDGRGYSVVRDQYGNEHYQDILTQGEDGKDFHTDPSTGEQFVHVMGQKEVIGQDPLVPKINDAKQTAQNLGQTVAQASNTINQAQNGVPNAGEMRSASLSDLRQEATGIQKDLKPLQQQLSDIQSYAPDGADGVAQADITQKQQIQDQIKFKTDRLAQVQGEVDQRDGLIADARQQRDQAAQAGLNAKTSAVIMQRVRDIGGIPAVQNDLETVAKGGALPADRAAALAGTGLLTQEAQPDGSSIMRVSSAGVPMLSDDTQKGIAADPTKYVVSANPSLPHVQAAGDAIADAAATSSTAPAPAPAQVRPKNYTVGDDGDLHFTPGNLSSGLTEAAQNGLIDPKKLGDLLPQAQAADKALAAQQRIAQENPAAWKAFVNGAGKGTAFLAGAAPGAAAGAEIGAFGGPFDFATVPAGSLIGGLIGGTVATHALSAVEDKLGQYSQTIKSFQDASQLHPYYDAAGNLISFAAGLPKIAGQGLAAGAEALAGKAAQGSAIGADAADVTANLSRIRAAGTGAQAVDEAGNAIAPSIWDKATSVLQGTAKNYQSASGVLGTIKNLSGLDAVNKAAGMTGVGRAVAIGGRVAGAAGTMVAIDTAIKEGSKALGINSEGQTLSGAAQAALIGAFAAGHNIELPPDVSPEQMGNIVTRMGVRTAAGIDLRSGALPQDAIPPHLDVLTADALKQPLTESEFQLGNAFLDEVRRQQATGDIPANPSADQITDLLKRTTGKQALSGGKPIASAVQIDPAEEAGTPPPGKSATPTGARSPQTAPSLPEGVSPAAKTPDGDTSEIPPSPKAGTPPATQALADGSVVPSAEPTITRANGKSTITLGDTTITVPTAREAQTVQLMQSGKSASKAPVEVESEDVTPKGNTPATSPAQVPPAGTKGEETPAPEAPANPSAQDNQPAEKVEQDNSPEITLPRQLAGAKPRYSYGPKQFQLSFASDLDKAAYTLAQSDPNKRHDDFLATAKEQSGLTTEQLVAHGQAVRASIKQLAKDGDPKAGPLIVEKQPVKFSSLTKQGDSAQNVNQGAENGTKGAIGEQSETVAPTKLDSYAKDSPVSERRGSTQLTLSDKDAKPFQNFARSIPDSAIYSEKDAAGKEQYGRELEPHVTSLYGLTGDGDSAAAVAPIAHAHGPVKIKVGKLSTFSHPDKPYDVLKADVHSDSLHELNGKLRALPHKSDFPDYHPHLTIAYVKKGMGAKLVAAHGSKFEGKEISFDHLTHSSADRVKTEIPLHAPDDAPITRDAAKATIQRLYGANAGYLRRQGISSADFEAQTGGASGLQFRDGKMEADPDKFARHLTTIRDNQRILGIHATTDDAVHAALVEEGIHGLQSQIAKEEGFQGIHEHYSDKELPDAALPADWEKQGRAARSDWDQLPKWAKKAEFVRMLVQHQASGKITEALYQRAEPIMERLEELVKSGGVHPTLKAYIDRLAKAFATTQVERQPEDEKPVQTETKPAISETNPPGNGPNPPPDETTRPPRSFKMPSSPTGEDDALDIIARHGGIVTEKNARAAGRVSDTAGDYDGAPTLGGFYHHAVYGGAMMPDQMAQILQSHGIGNGSTDGLWTAIGQARAMRDTLREAKQRHAVAQAQADRFEKDAKQPDTAKGETKLYPGSLSMGDKVQVGSQTLTVIGMDSESVELEDHSRYGLQTVPDGTPIYVEKITSKTGDGGGQSPAKVPDGSNPNPTSLSPQPSPEAGSPPVAPAPNVPPPASSIPPQDRRTSDDGSTPAPVRKPITGDGQRAAKAIAEIKARQAANGGFITPGERATMLNAQDIVDRDLNRQVLGPNPKPTSPWGKEAQQRIQRLQDARAAGADLSAAQHAQWKNDLALLQNDFTLQRQALEVHETAEVSHNGDSDQPVSRKPAVAPRDAADTDKVAAARKWLADQHAAGEYPSAEKIVGTQKVPMNVARQLMADQAQAERAAGIAPAPLSAAELAKERATPARGKAPTPTPAPPAPAPAVAAGPKPDIRANQSVTFQGRRATVESIDGDRAMIRVHAGPAPGNPSVNLVGKRMSVSLKNLAAAQRQPSARTSVPTLRSGEKQGDLLSKQSEDLTLVGEKGVDHAARQAEQERQAREAAEAKAKQEEDQHPLFASAAEDETPVDGGGNLSNDDGRAPETQGGNRSAENRGAFGTNKASAPGVSAEIGRRGGPPDAGSRPASSAIQRESIRQAEVLAQTAKANGQEIAPEQLARLGPVFGRGQEHLVRRTPDGQRAVKMTVGGRNGYGITPYVRGDEIGFRPGTPAEYLDRLALQNKKFGDDQRYEGMTRDGRGEPRIVTSQPFIKGTRPNSAEIAQYMASMGFEPVAGHEGNAFYRASDNVGVFDAHEGNFIKSAQGIVPIDVAVVHPDDRLLQVLERGLQGDSLGASAAEPIFPSETVPPPDAAEANRATGAVSSFVGNITKRLAPLAHADAIPATYDAGQTRAGIMGTQAGRSVHLDIPDDADREAATAVVESGGKRAVLENDLARVKASPDKDLAEQYAPVYQRALDNLDRLTPLTANYQRIKARETSAAQNAGLPNVPWEPYVEQVLDDPKLGESLATDKGLGTNPGYRTNADAIAAGVAPRSMDLSDVAAHQVQRNRLAVNDKEFQDMLAGMKATDGKPLLSSIQENSTSFNKNGDVKSSAKLPAGYDSVQAGGSVLVIHKEYAPLVSALYGKSLFDTNAALHGLKVAAAFAKHGTVGIGDTYHLFRTAASAILGFGAVDYRKGLAGLNYAPEDLPRAVAAGEITQAQADEAKANAHASDVLLRSGFNAGKVTDNLMDQLKGNGFFQRIPVLAPAVSKLNHFIFEQYQRGIAHQCAIIAFNRLRAQNPGMDEMAAGRQAAKEINAYFGNLGNQGVLKNKTMQDLARLVMLAPQFAEGKFTTEARGYAQAARIPVDLARGRGLRVGNIARALGGVVLASLVGNQLLNLFTKGQPTWNNEDGHKFDAWVPGGPNNRGFYFSPLSIAAEYSHAMLKYMEGGAGALDAGIHIASNKLGPLARGAKDLLTGEDYAGHPFGSTAERLKAAAVDAAPSPLPLSGVLTKDPKATFGYKYNRETGSLERQGLSMIGLKVDAAQSARAKMFRLADPYRTTHAGGGTVSAYGDLRHMLDNGDLGGAREEIGRLVGSGHRLAQIGHAFGIQADGALHPELFTGSKANEARMLHDFTPDQRKTYFAAQKEHAQLAQRFRRAAGNLQEVAQAT